MFEAFFEIADVDGAVLPSVLSFAVGFSVFVLAGIGVTGDENISASSLFKCHIPLSLVAVTIFPRVNTVTVSFGFEPFTDV